jgi:hypothetical protein
VRGLPVTEEAIDGLKRVPIDAVIVLPKAVRRSAGQ